MIIHADLSIWKSLLHIPAMLCLCVCVLSHPAVLDFLWPHGSPSGPSVHRISQARILVCITISGSRAYSQARDGIPVFCVSNIGRQINFLEH